MAHLQSSIGDPLSAFLATFPTPLHYKKPKSVRDFWVFWSQNQQSQENSSTDDPGLVPQPDSWVVHEKIKSLFSDYLYGGNSDVLIQFWAPATTGGRRLLTTSGQPFALKNLGTGLEKYRLFSLDYQHDVDVNKLEVEKDSMIITGGPASAFLNQLAEVVLDLEAHKGCPLARSDLAFSLRACILLPICDPSRGCCVGVVECVMRHSGRVFGILDMLTSALKKADLSTFYVCERLPYKTIDGLKCARDKIEEALKIVCESHNLDLAQVWIPEENHVPFSSSTKDTQMKRGLAFKLVGYDRICYSSKSCYTYYNAFDVLPLKMGEGLARKAFQNDELHFCRDISELSYTDLLGSFDSFPKRSCFVIRLRSNYTCDFDYVFEFVWPQHRNYVILLESLLFTLKNCLPNFKFASGAKLGDELFVVDVENSSGNKIRFFKICKGNRLSPKPKASEEEKSPMVEECIVPTTMVNSSADIESLYGDQLSTFLEKFPTQLHYMGRKGYGHLWVFWSQNERSQNNSFSDDPGLVPESPDHRVIYEKIKSTFSVLSDCEFGGLIQFWAPVTTGGRRRLTTSDQPFALGGLYTEFAEFRLRFLDYHYDVDVNQVEVEEDPMIITPSTAFLNHWPELVLDLRAHQRCPLVRYALECDFTSYMVLPVCYRSSQRGCVGVLECFMDESSCYPLKILRELDGGLKEVDLSTFYVRERLPCETIHVLEPAKDEIGEALKTVCESHDIGLAQVWIPFEEENHVPFSSSTKDTRMKPVLPLNLVGYTLKDESLFGVTLKDKSLFGDYHVACDMLALQMWEGLPGKTLQNHEPHFCRDPSELGDTVLRGLCASCFDWKLNWFVVYA